MRRLQTICIGIGFYFALNQCNVNASLNHPFDGARGLVSNQFVLLTQELARTGSSALNRPTIIVRYNGIEYKNGDTLEIKGTKSNTNYPAELTIVNNSNVNLNLTASGGRAIIGGVNASNFTATNPSLSILIPGASSTFTVNFNVNTLGDKVADVTIPNDDLTNSSFKLNLKGVFEPKETWVYTASLNQQRQFHSTVLLKDGRVLTIGGFSSGFTLSSCEIYDPVLRTWTLASPMIEARLYFSAQVLNDGRVLVTGGIQQDRSGTVLARLKSTEIYNPETKLWTSGPSMTVDRDQQSLTLLTDGRVLITGGRSSISSKGTDIYDPVTETITARGNMTYDRRFHSSIVLDSNEVLIVGGGNESGFAIQDLQSEIFNPINNSWRTVGNLYLNSLPTRAVKLKNGKVLRLGKGIDVNLNAEIFDPLTESWAASSQMKLYRIGPSVTSIKDGKVFIIGGGTIFGLTSPAKSVEIYDSDSNSFILGQDLNFGRTNHDSILLNNGQILVVGGDNSTTELYFP